MKMKDFESAERHFRKALNIAKDSKLSEEDLAISRYHLGLVLQFLGDEAGYQYLESVQKMIEGTNNGKAFIDPEAPPGSDVLAKTYRFESSPLPRTLIMQVSLC